MTDIPSQGGEFVDDRSSRVPAYALVGNRMKESKPTNVPLEALVQATGGPFPSLTSERKQIVSLTSQQFLSVAELSVHMQLPLGVVQILVADLVALQCVRLATDEKKDPANNLTIGLLESVLHGISAL